MRSARCSLSRLSILLAPVLIGPMLAAGLSAPVLAGPMLLSPANAVPASSGLSRPDMSPLLVPVKEPCIRIGGKRFCLEVDEDDDNAGGGGGGGGAKNDEAPDGNGGGADDDCGEGYVKLDKPNIYGALCEPVGGLQKPESVTCRADQVGVHPNCQCPTGMEEKNGACVAIPPPPPPPPPPVSKGSDPRNYCSENLDDTAKEAFRANCKTVDANNIKAASCFSPAATPGIWSCCCQHLK